MLQLHTDQLKLLLGFKEHAYINFTREETSVSGLAFEYRFRNCSLHECDITSLKKIEYPMSCGTQFQHILILKIFRLI